jgi:hypothetical protein
MESYTRNGGIIGKVMDFGAADFYSGVFDTNTKLVMNFNDTNGSTNFVDSTSTVTFPTVVGATISTTQSKYGGSSGYFNGSSYITSTYSADLVFGTNPFTIEAWIYSPSGQNTGSNHTIICVAEAQSATNWQFSISSGYLYFWIDTGNVNNSTTLIPTNQWVHVAAVREGTGTNQFKLYLNGTLWATGTNAVNYSYAVGLRLGMNRGSNAYFNGYIDDVRIVNGTALYTAAFTPPTSELVGPGNKKNSGIWDLQAVLEYESIAPPGQAEFTTPGTFSWTAPEGVTSVCVVCVGGGGGGGSTGGSGGGGGGGGGLGWKNNITVVPGNSYTVVVGGGGPDDSATNGGNSYFIDTSTVAGFGGTSSSTATGGIGGSFVGGGGGNGGSPANSGELDSTGGGGAGGYSGNGGGSSVNTNGQAGSGGAGGGGAAGGSGDAASGGGGVGIYGEGASGAGGVYTGNDAGAGGGGGSGGTDGAAGTTLNGNGGAFGGGGAGAELNGETGAGAGGAVRIIWGVGRAFPSTGTADV